MTTPSTTQQPSKAPYPEDNDHTIRQWAGNFLINDQDAINTLNTIRNEMFGNADKVYQLANTWSKYTALNSQFQTIQEVSTNLAGNWQGQAKEQYDSFSGSNGGVLTVLKNDQTAMSDVGTTLAACAAQVYQTYANAIDAISSCAGKIGQIVTESAFSDVPVVGEVLDAEAVNQLFDALGDFVSGVAKLIGDSVAQIGQYKQNGVLFNGAANLFSAIPAPGSLMGITTDWTKETKS